jgi:hypothetical protein
MSILTCIVNDVIAVAFGVTLQTLYRARVSITIHLVAIAII